MRIVPLHATFLGLIIGLPSCARSRAAAESLAETSNSKTPPAPLMPYPPGRWRLDPGQLANVVLWTSHIVIRYRDVSNTGPCFNLGNWFSESAKVERSREEALSLIRQLRGQLVKQPERFAELAALHSEDLATRALGGSLGGIQAVQLTPWPEVLDTLAQTSAGSISEVVETAYGFHVFQRRLPPPGDTVTGARIVVAHNQARWLQHIARGTVPSRTRAQASTLADELYGRAKARPEEFPNLVEQYSEHLDAVRSGDMGTWSLQEVMSYPRETEILSKLAVGEVAPPIDSPVGFEILRRMPNRTREWYALEQVSVSFSPSAFGEESPTQIAALAQMREFSKQIQRKPKRFAELQQQYCCTGNGQWQDGRGWPTLTDVLSRTPLGEVAREPLMVKSTYVLAKRVEPVIPQTPAVVYDMPEPESPQIEPYIASHSGDAIANVLSASTEEARASLGLPPDMLERISTSEGDLDRFDQIPKGEDKIAAYKATLSELSTILGASSYARYQSVLNANWERYILRH